VCFPTALWLCASRLRSGCVLPDCALVVCFPTALWLCASRLRSGCVLPDCACADAALNRFFVARHALDSILVLSFAGASPFRRVRSRTLRSPSPAGSRVRTSFPVGLLLHSVPACREPPLHAFLLRCTCPVSIILHVCSFRFPSLLSPRTLLLCRALMRSAACTLRSTDRVLLR
jgi:hypothetical protein